MPSQLYTNRVLVALVLVLQFIPLVLFPPESFSPTTQEWWLPVLLAIMVLAADFELIVRGGINPWPWYLISFAQGFNIISRLMMVWPHATIFVGQNTGLNVPYIVLTAVSIALSIFMLVYIEKPGVRMTLSRG